MKKSLSYALLYDWYYGNIKTLFVLKLENQMTQELEILYRT